MECTWSNNIVIPIFTSSPGPTKFSTARAYGAVPVFEDPN